MRKKEINRIYNLVKAVEDRERSFDQEFALRDVDDDLREAKRQLHAALADLSVSELRQPAARSVR